MLAELLQLLPGVVQRALHRRFELLGRLGLLGALGLLQVPRGRGGLHRLLQDLLGGLHHLVLDLLQQAIDGLGDLLLRLRRDVLELLLRLVPVLCEELLGLPLRSPRVFQATLGLLLERGERLAQRRLAVPHQALQLLDQLLERALHLFGKHLVGGLGVLVTVLGVLLRLLELRFRLFGGLLRPVPVVLRGEIQCFLALRDRFLPLAPGFLPALHRALGGLVELLELLELLLVLVVFGLDLVVDLLGLLAGFLRLGRELADLRFHRLDELRQR